MGGVVADQLQRLRVLLGDDADLGVLLDGPEQVPIPCRPPSGSGRPWPGPGRWRRRFRPGHALGERQGLAVGQGHGHLIGGSGHGNLLEKPIGADLWPRAARPPSRAAQLPCDHYYSCRRSCGTRMDRQILGPLRGGHRRRTSMKTIMTALGADGLAIAGPASAKDLHRHARHRQQQVR